MTANRVVIFQRGAVAVSREEAITQGLNLANLSSSAYRDDVKSRPPGLFFNMVVEGTDSRDSPEFWAKQIAERERVKYQLLQK